MPPSVFGTGARFHGAEAGYPYLVARDIGGIGKEYEDAGQQGDVEDIHPGSTEGLLPDPDGKSHSYGQYPKGNIGWHDQRYEGTGNQKTLFYGMAFLVGVIKFDAQADQVGHDKDRNDLNEPVSQFKVYRFQKTRMLSQGHEMLMAYIVGSKQVT